MPELPGRTGANPLATSPHQDHEAGAGKATSRTIGAIINSKGQAVTKQIRQPKERDMRAMIAAGVDMAKEQIRSDVTMDESHVMWALLCEAADVSGRAYSAPPRTGYPSKSAMPDAPDDVSYWHMMMSYIRGEVQDAPTDKATKPTPSAEQIDRTAFVLDLWHHHVLTRKGQRSKIKRAVYLKACGLHDKPICVGTGLSRSQINRAKAEAMRDMWEVMRRY